MSSEEHPINTAAVYLDARLEAVSDAGMLRFAFNGRSIVRPARAGVEKYLRDKIGAVGVVDYVRELGAWRFIAYLDQSLRRMPELDDGDRTGWSNDTKPEGWTAPRSIIPGDLGKFVEDETESVPVRVPTEFFDLCESFGVEPERLLGGFIADVCGIQNLVNCPRADHMDSHGSDERMLAQDYLERTWAGRGRRRA